MNTQQDSPRGKSLQKSTQNIMDQKLWLKILIGMVFGIIVGYILSPQGAAILENDLALSLGEWLGLPGTLFLGLIKMVIIPLIVCSIVLGIAESGSMEFLQKIGLRLIPYFIMTTAISITIGLLLVNTIKPGLMLDNTLVENTLSTIDTSIPSERFDNLTIPQRIGNIIPVNPAKAQLEGDMLQIVIASILLGIAMITIPRSAAKPMNDLCMSGQVISMKIISWAMAIAPYAVFGLLANITIKTGLDALGSVAIYSATVLAGLACMLVVYCILIATFSKMRIRDFLSGIKEVQLLAFSTSSSAATMPFSIEAAE